MACCSQGLLGVKGARDTHLPSSWVFTSHFHTPSSLSSRSLSPHHTGSSFPPFPLRPSCFCFFLQPTSNPLRFHSIPVFCDDASHITRTGRHLAVLHALMKEAGDVFFFHFQVLSAFPKLSLKSRVNVSISWGHRFLFQESYLASCCWANRSRTPSQQRSQTVLSSWWW